MIKKIAVVNGVYLLAAPSSRSWRTTNTVAVIPVRTARP